MRTIIHFFDDEKFIDYAINIFEKNPVSFIQHLYVVLDNGRGIKNVKYQGIKQIKRSNIEEILNMANNSFAIFIHALDEYKQDIVLNINSNATIYWFCWGFDLYVRWPDYSKNLYDNETKKIINYKPVQRKLKDFIKQILFSIFNLEKYKPLKGSFSKEKYVEALNRIKFCAPVIEPEIDLVKNINPNIKYVPFSYGFLDQFLGDSRSISIKNERNILVGNSADPSNNHISILKRLAELNLGDRKIIVPLSYSGNETYISKVIKKGKQLLGKKFVPIVEFMPLEKYNEVIFSCGIVIFNHKRQQALGNLIAMCYLGAKIYIDHASPIFEYFKEKGINLYDNNNLSEIFSPINDLEINDNKQILEKLYGEKNVFQKAKDLLKTLEK